MGEEIEHDQFTNVDFQEYKERLIQETAVLEQWFFHKKLSRNGHIAGLELEAWIVDAQGHPAPCNRQCLREINDSRVVPELAKFNIELNVQPQPLRARGLKALEQELSQTWSHCGAAIAPLGLDLAMIGILPTVNAEDLNPDNMSEMKRYKALNEQVLAARQGRPIQLEILGRERIRRQHQDVMLESAATSFQLHLQVPFDDACFYYNASVLLSAPMVALAANSPYLFGMDLWHETRIPLFEQAVEVGGYEGATRGPVRRVTFGNGFVRHSVSELFRENLEHYPILIPTLLEGANKLPHMRLHNGTIWRWNRPLLGFDSDGTPHIRIEHRVMPAGPTVVDMIANAAFFYGLVEVVSGEISHGSPLEKTIPFSTCKDNFYTAARNGLGAGLVWLQGEKVNVADLILKQLLPQSEKGLVQLGVDSAHINEYLGIIEQRVSGGRNGAWWQRSFVAKHGSNMPLLLQAYLQRQRQADPVHTWTLD